MDRPAVLLPGVIAIIISGIMLKKTKMFAGPTSPFVMELPSYHMPTVKSILMSTWDRIKGYIVKAGTIIFLSTIVIWLLMNFGDAGEGFGLLDTEMDDYIQYSLMAGLGNGIGWIFAPLGFGDWQATVTSITGLVAKENVVATVGILTSLGDVGEADPTMWAAFAALFAGSVPAILAFCAFNLLCAPCFAAIGTIWREMGTAKWTWFTIGYMTIFAWCVGLMFYQFGGLLTGEIGFNVWTVVAIVVLAGMLFQISAPCPPSTRRRTRSRASLKPRAASRRRSGFGPEEPLGPVPDVPRKDALCLVWSSRRLRWSSRSSCWRSCSSRFAAWCATACVIAIRETTRTADAPEDAAAARAAALPAPWWPTCRSEPLRSRTANRPIRRAS